MGAWLKLRALQNAAPLAAAAMVLAYWAGDPVLLFAVTLLPPAALWLMLRTAPGRDGDGRDFTGVATREAARSAVAGALALRRRSGRAMALILAEPAGIGALRDTAGIEAADMLLCAIGTRLADRLRKGDTVARMDGAVFGIVLTSEAALDAPTLSAICDRLAQAFARPLMVDGRAHPVRLILGACAAGTSARDDASSIEEGALQALAEARRLGGAGAVLYSARMQAAARRREARAAEIAEALSTGRIRAWFQPQVSTDTGAVTGFEALARWHHPTDGVLAPGVFLADITAAGLTGRLADVILDDALRALVGWHRAGHDIASVGVNYTSAELSDPALAERLKWAVDAADLPPASLTVEVLESVLGEGDEDAIAQNIRGLSQAGFGIDLDDFGTGHAAIASIRRFAVRRIKIDRGFVAGIDADPERRMLVEAMIRMAESLKVETLAEGVETLAEQALLAQMGCGHIQGYGLARPMPFDETLIWLDRHREKLARTPKLTARKG